MVNVVCVNWGTYYEDKYINVLYDMVSEYLTPPFRFICFTDRKRQIYREIETRPTATNLEGWWQKIYLFKAGVLQGPTLFLDLDVVIKGSLDFVTSYMDKDFVSIKDFSGLPTYNTSMMLWKPEKCTRIFDWITPKAIKRFHSDQEFISAVLGLYHFFPDHTVSSFKWSDKKRIENASVVVFHGKPKPHEADHPITNKWWGKK